jgi:hypothetical protein
VCDRIDQRHQAILPARVWGDGDPEGVRQRAADEMIATAEAAVRLGVEVVNGFTGSSIWHLLYSFPPVTAALINAGYDDFAARWRPILDRYAELGVRFALEVHPTEIAFDIASAERALEALDHHPAFGFNYDGTPLKSVEVRVDNGPWQAAGLSASNTRYSWKFFSYQWNNLAPGEHTIVSRATDANGVAQPEEADLADKKTMWENNGQFVRRFTI